MALTPMKRFYLDFDSTYRDRNLWPNPGEFEVMLSQSGTTGNPISAKDPVSTATPILSWSSQRFQADASVTPSVSGTIIGPPGLGAANSARVIIFQTLAGNLQQTYNYYKHAVLSGMTNEGARITEFVYMGNNIGQTRVDKDLSLLPGDVITIEDPSDLIDPSYGKLFVPNGGDGADDYFTKYIYNESIGQSRRISGYDEVTGILTIKTPPVPTWMPSHNYSIRESLPLIATVAGAASTQNTVVITGGTSQDYFYVGAFIRLPKINYSNVTIQPEGEMRRITAYDGSTQTATVFPRFSTTTANKDIEVLPFSYDNANPFTYKGTLESEASVYSIRLISLTLPNKTLLVCRGGQIAFYPYVYVELTASDNPSNNLIMSNNPNAVKMMFRSSIDDIHNLNATFISLDGDSMVQVFRFKAETNFKVKVILPNGQTFQTVEKETVSPNESNPYGQISMMFELLRG